MVTLDQHLQHSSDAEKVLSRIDELPLLVQGQSKNSNISRLLVANGASFGSYDEQYEGGCVSGANGQILNNF